MARRKAATGKRSRPGRLRIVAGKWRSRLLPIVDLPGLRPTSERIRETLFNWLSAELIGRRCLDLFAGTGALGFEALSREARAVTFVEQAPEAVENLRTIARTLDAHGADIRKADAVSFLERRGAAPYDLVFLDPPFAADLLEHCCGLLQSNGWLNANALVYVEQDRGRPLPEFPEGWNIEKEKTAGNVRYALLRVNVAGETGEQRGAS